MTARRTEADVALKAVAEANEALAEARAADEAAQKLEAAARSLADLEAKQPQIDALKVTVAAARKAERAAPAAAALAVAEAGLREAQAELTSAQQKLSGAQAGELAAASALKAEEERGPQREAAAAKVRDLVKLGETVERWRAANAELSAADAAHVEALDVLSRAKAAREAAVADAEQVKQRIVAAEQAAAELKSAEQARVEARRVAALCGERDAAVEALGAAEAERAVAEAAFQDALALFTTLQTKFVELEASARAGRAAAIARELVTGEPCPVCGSTSAPGAGARRR